MTTIAKSAAAALVGLVALAGQVQALPAVQAEFRLSYYPPNPCIALGSPTLDGLATLYLGDMRDGDLGSRRPATPLACSDDGSVSTFRIRFDAPTDGSLSFDFVGALDPGGAKVFAMPNPGLPDAPPLSAPRLTLGNFVNDIFESGEVKQWTLVSYAELTGTGAQPAVSWSFTEIGTIEVAVSAIPEPATVLAALAGLAALAATHRRTRAPAAAGSRDARSGAGSGPASHHAEHVT